MDTFDHDHHFTDAERAEYDSLRAAGRSMYDDLRWYESASHETAFNVARHTYGLKADR